MMFLFYVLKAWKLVKLGPLLYLLKLACLHLSVYVKKNKVPNNSIQMQDTTIFIPEVPDTYLYNIYEDS